MAVAVQLDFEGATLGQYDEMNEMIGSLPGSPPPPDEIFHWVMGTDEGFRVIDLWASREAFEQFERAKLRPIYEEVGIPHLPKIQFFEVHNYAGSHRRR
jgi:hypothetical protein